MLQGNGYRCIALEGQAAGDHLVHHHTQGIQVGAVVHITAPGLLGRHIMDRTDGLTLAVGVFPGGKMGDAEIGHLYGAVPQQHDVLGLDIPVDDVMVVGMLQSACDLSGKNSHFLGRQAAPAAEVFLQGDAVDQLHDDVIHVSRPGNVINIDNIGMGQHGDGLGLFMKLAAKLLVRGKLLL